MKRDEIKVVAWDLIANGIYYVCRPAGLGVQKTQTQPKTELGMQKPQICYFLARLTRTYECLS